ncbi:MAG: NAD-dependent malic enzyme [Verrucomicrobiota bacterium]
MPKVTPPSDLPRGFDLLNDPLLNKGTAFLPNEREAFGLVGLLPEQVESIDLQLARVEGHLDQKTTDLARYVFLNAVFSENETLFFHTLMSDPARYMPLVYTPTVGEACQKYGHILRRPEGLYLGVNQRGRIKEILRHWPQPDIRFIVVTDGERILGLGDLGAGGMGIPIGKLNLYTACAGVPPRHTLPVTLDVGTNNEELLRDPLYHGIRQPRVTGEAYFEFVDEFVWAVQEVFPDCCIQFEDFANVHAVPLLAKYRDQVCCYNDDIQGTASVALAGLFGCLRITGGKLSDQVFLFAGAGSAGTGIADLIAQAIVAHEGLPLEEARRRCWLFDVNGLLTTDRTDLADFQRPFAHDHAPAATLLQAVQALRPSAIIGVSTVPKLFSEEVIRAMAAHHERPIIFPYSNPTSRSECTAQEAYTWTDGRAVFASGSPFGPVTLNGRRFVPGQGNNVYIFPAMGLAIYATKARRVPDRLFIRCAEAVAEQVTPQDLEEGLIYPPMADIFATSVRAATRVAELIFEEGLAQVEKPADLDAFIQSKLFRPEYVEWDV